MQSPWLVRQPGPVRPFRLYCFPYAGGGASAFLSWQALLGPAVEICAIQLPGRGTRIGEAPYASLAVLARDLAHVLAGQSKSSFAFFGHSMGALLAFEVSRHLAACHLPTPNMLFVSGCAAPAHRGEERNLHELEDEALIAKLKEFNGTPPELLQDGEMMALALPSVRADFAMVAKYQYRRALLLHLPIIVLAGTSDDHCEEANLEAWREETTGPFSVHRFEGDHFFIKARQSEVMACLRTYIT
jgi:medium-chain acyl-[acyl-carrier-protein] hydrolase